MAGLKGNKKLIQNLRKMAKKSPKAAGSAIFREGEEIMANSKDKFVPVDLGALKDSGFTNLPVIRSNGATVTIGYGGAAAAYALAIHEHPSGHSPPSWKGSVNFRVGGPKYLELPFNEAIPGMPKRLASNIQDFLIGFGV